MGVKKYKPTSPGRRHQTVSDFAEITTNKPEKSLLEALPKKAGRNAHGHITVRHQGGGHKRKYRKITEYIGFFFILPRLVYTVFHPAYIIV